MSHCSAARLSSVAGEFGRSPGVASGTSTFATARDTATVSMTVNYVGRAQGDLLASARCLKRGRDLNFSEIRVDDTNGTLVATGTLVYRIVP